MPSRSAGQRLAKSSELEAKIHRVLSRRASRALETFNERVRSAYEKHRVDLSSASGPWEALTGWARYSIDFAQRSVLFWDTLRQRGNNFIEHNQQGAPPLLHFDYEMVLDGRTLATPVNYALVRIVAPKGVKTDTNSRPYVIIDPRAGHGPGIGGFKDDSQVGVALRAGHPVYFVIFFTEPEPGQTLLDVCAAEREFVHRVRELHPRAPKPAIIGNCQGGWAAMMLAAANPDDTGPIVINGAPMSYWGGAWDEGEGDNPMRYAGGLLGGTWLASFVSDLGAGKFDGAWLVQNFENLNPANTFWDKYYHVFANIDTEPPRFLEFERWWGGFYLMNSEEIEWITRNLFVGNKLWSGTVKSGSAENGGFFDLRELKVPIILFASMGDNITPPQQAFNWVADVYGSTDEIKARGQVIVGLVHQDIGHLGIFVSGKVAKKEHRQIVTVLESVESLPPGLYAMHIAEDKGADGKVTYDVSFTERRLEDIVEKLNRFKRADEKPFESVEEISEFNQRAYEIFGRPVVRALANEQTAKLGRQLHPLRAQRWAVSDLNPFLWWLGPAAESVKAHRQAVGPDAATRKAEKLMSELTSASLDYYRAIRDAASEAVFFRVYGNLFNADIAQAGETHEQAAAEDARSQPLVRKALATIDKGGYADAVSRVLTLLSRRDEPLALSLLELKRDMAREYAELLPNLPVDEWRRIRGRQEVIVRYEPEKAVETLPALLAAKSDRQRMQTLLERLERDQRVLATSPTKAQLAMLARIHNVLGFQAIRRRPRAKPTPAKPAKRAERVTRTK